MLTHASFHPPASPVAVGSVGKTTTRKEAQTNSLSLPLSSRLVSPGATLALGLMFIKSNNTSVAARLALPDTHFLLDYVRPDMLMLRVISRALVLWDTVLPTTAWVKAQIPDFIRQAFDSLPLASSGRAGLDPSIDRQSIRQAHANIVAGACFALGLRYASTGESMITTALHWKEEEQPLSYQGMKMDPLSKLELSVTVQPRVPASASGPTTCPPPSTTRFEERLTDWKSIVDYAETPTSLK